MTSAQEELLKEARESIGAARHLVAGGYFDFAVARAYYAMFYAAQAMLLEQGLVFSKHGSLLAAVGQYLVKPGHLPAQLHRNLIKAYDARIEGDYEPGLRFTEEAATSRIAQAEEFLTAAEEKLTPPLAT